MSTKVLVVDDSLTMRALISRALDGISGVDVVGTADGAAEARELREKLQPDVMTLDIEMPGMSGIDYLAEVMGKAPMPVIMFSTLTEAGANASVEALRLGAVDCFPKPKVATQSEFDLILGKLAKCIKTAKSATSRRIKAEKPAVPVLFDWNGRVLVIGADAASTTNIFDLLGAFPANCPPTVVVQHVRADLADSIITKLDEQVAPRVVRASEGFVLEQGTVCIATPGEAHVVLDKWPDGGLRAMPRDPIAGERPSISLLFASAAKAAGGNAVGLLMTAGGEDGQAGIKGLLAAGAHVLVQPPELAEKGEYLLHKGMVSQPVPSSEIAATLLRLCAK